MWAANIPWNFVAALPWNLLVAGPFSRWLFRCAFLGGTVLAEPVAVPRAGAVAAAAAENAGTAL